MEVICSYQESYNDVKIQNSFDYKDNYYQLIINHNELEWQDWQLLHWHKPVN